MFCVLSNLPEYAECLILQYILYVRIIMTTVKCNESSVEVINKTTTYTTDTLTPTNVVHNTTSLRLAIAKYQSNSYKLLSNQQHINFRSELSKSRCTIRIHNAWYEKLGRKRPSFKITPTAWS